MFEQVTEKINDVFDTWRGRGKLSEEDVQDGLKEIRKVLLAADVHFSVVKKFINRLEDEATGEEVLDDLNPGEQVIKVVRDELEDLLGEGEARLDLRSGDPLPIVLVGLQGTGKTTTATKLAQHYRGEGHNPLLISTDDQRPAAQDQLEQTAQEHNLPIYTHDMSDTVGALDEAREQADEEGNNPLIVDTAGRLNIDEPMIEEVQGFLDHLPEARVILVLDGMMGQEALTVAEDFHESAPLDGLILTKMDGDARGGAAISAREVTGVPILYLGTGESIDELQPFHPDRMASRILGMGDVLSLIEEAEEAADEEEQEELQQRMLEGNFTMDDVETQLTQLQNMGPLEGILEKLPGGFKLKDQLNQANFDPEDIDRLQAIIRAMTEEEKQDPDIIDGSRRRRIAVGSGTSVQQVNQLLKQYEMMNQMMEQFQSDDGGMMKKMADNMGLGGMLGR